MLFAPTLADKAILPRAWGGRYFFNRIGRKQPVVKRRKRVLAVAHVTLTQQHVTRPVDCAWAYWLQRVERCRG